MAASMNVNYGAQVEERFPLTPNKFQLKTLGALQRENDVFSPPEKAAEKACVIMDFRVCGASCLAMNDVGCW